MLTFILVTFLIPPLILAADYVQKTEMSAKELLQKAGPDLCSLGLGASVPILLDPRVRIALGEQGPAVEIIGILLIFVLRGVCVRLNKQPLPDRYWYVGTALGAGSIFLVGAIMLIAYI